MDLGFSSHAFHSSARLVFMNATLSSDRTELTFTTPPNGRVYPPGPATIFLTVDDVSSPVSSALVQLTTKRLTCEFTGCTGHDGQWCGAASVGMNIPYCWEFYVE